MNNDFIKPIRLTRLGKAFVAAFLLAVVSLIVGFGWGFLTAYAAFLVASFVYFGQILWNMARLVPAPILVKHNR